MVEASLLWVTVFRSSGRLTSSGSLKLVGADWAWTACVVVAVVVGVFVVGVACADGLASLFEQADRRTARTAAATNPRCVPIVVGSPIGPVRTPRRPEAGAPDESVRTPSVSVNRSRWRLSPSA